MRSFARVHRARPGGIALLAAVVSAALAGRAPAADPGDILPPETFLLLEVKDLDALREKAKGMSLYGLYKEPAMQPFVGPAEKKIRERIDQGLKKTWKQAGIEAPPGELPWPHGQVVLAMRVGFKTFQLPNYQWDPEARRMKVIGTREMKQPVPEILVMADMGQDLPAAKQLIARLAEGSVDKGWQRQRQTVRGVEIETLRPPKRKPPPGLPEGVRLTLPEPDPVAYAFKGSTVLFASNVEFLKQVVLRQSGVELPSMGAAADRRNAVKAIGGPGDVNFYLDVQAVLKATKLASPKQAEKMTKVFTALGLDGVPGVAAKVMLAPKPAEEVRLIALVATRGQRTGIPAAAAPAPMDMKPGRLVTKGLGSFLVVNYDLGKLYDQVAEMVLAAEGKDLNQAARGLMALTGGEGEDARPPVDLRKDILGQLSGPITVITRLEKPYTDPKCSKTMVALGVRDGGILDAALARMHEALMAGGKPEMRRALLNRTIYLLPERIGRQLRIAGWQDTELAFSVAGSHFVFGPVASVEQAIRDLRATKLEPIASDPMFQHARRYLPARAGAFFYENAQMSSEAMWTQLKEAAKQAARQPKGEDPRLGPGQAGALPTSPMGLLVTGLKDYCDFTTLPDFEAVRRYFGASVGWVTTDQNGIRLEMIGLKPPKGQ